MSAAPLLEVEDLAVAFETRRGRTDAVRGVSFSLRPGELVGVIGESGCGKSVMSRALMGLVDPPGRVVGGSVRFEGRDVLALDDEQLRSVRGAGVAMVFQDPMTSLNPVFTIGRQLEMAMEAHGTPDPAERAEQLLRDVEIPRAAERLTQYPHEMSGGMRQRVMIAMALANRPSLVIADEPTTALDVTIQAQVLDLLRRINEEQGTALLLISHNLGVVAELAERVIVVYAGKIVEQGPTRDVFTTPAHPYTQALLRAMPREDGTPLASLSGAPPSLSPPPPGCAFAARCTQRVEVCEQDPPHVAVGADRGVACWVAADRLGVEAPR